MSQTFSKKRLQRRHENGTGLCVTQGNRRGRQAYGCARNEARGNLIPVVDIRNEYYTLTGYKLSRR
jgi:hypothetical protein